MAELSAYVTATTSAQNVTINGPAEGVLVTNLDGLGFVAFRVDGETAGAANENHFLGATAGAQRAVRVKTWPATVSVYASASTKVAVEAIGE